MFITKYVLLVVHTMHSSNSLFTDKDTRLQLGHHSCSRSTRGCANVIVLNPSLSGIVLALIITIIIALFIVRTRRDIFDLKEDACAVVFAEYLPHPHALRRADAQQGLQVNTEIWTILLQREGQTCRLVRRYCEPTTHAFPTIACLLANNFTIRPRSSRIKRVWCVRTFVLRNSYQDAEDTKTSIAAVPVHPPLSVDHPAYPTASVMYFFESTGIFGN